MAEWVRDFTALISKGVPSFRHALNSELLWQTNLPRGYWFYMEITPLSEEKSVVTQVLRDLMVNVKSFEIINNGCVSHDDDLPEKLYRFSKDDSIIIDTIKPKTYKVALWEGSRDEKIEQLRNPSFFVLEPEVNQLVFPKHPHLNPAQITNKGVLMPPALCYEYDFSSLGSSRLERMKNAYVRMCIWLFRHQIWEARTGDPLKRWPGKEYKTDEKLVDKNRIAVAYTSNVWSKTFKAIEELFYL